jgi:hypothetical protein
MKKSQRIRHVLAGSVLVVCLVTSLRSLFVLHRTQFQQPQQPDLAPILAEKDSRHGQELEAVRANATAVIHALQQELAIERTKLSSPVSSGTQAQVDSSTPPTLPGVCSLLAHSLPSQLSLWNAHGAGVLNATTFVNDHKHQLDDFTVQILQLILPRLPRSIQTLLYS